MKDFGMAIQSKRKEKDLSLRDLAILCDLSHSYIDSLEKGFDPRTGKPVSPTVETIKKLSRGLGMPNAVLLELAGLDVGESSSYVIQEETDPEICSVSRAMKKMPSEKRKKMLKLLKITFEEEFGDND